MKHWLGILLVPFLAGCSDSDGGAQSQQVQRSRAADEQQIRALQEEWMQAWVRQDRAAIENLLAPDYQLIVSSMPDRPITREQWIGMLPRYTAQGFAYDKMVVRMFGDMAVVSSLGTAKGAKVDGADRSFTFFLTDVWRKRDGQWQVVGRYSSVPEGETASSRALGSR